MKCFVGGDEEEECLDLSELVAMLIIVYLIKVAKFIITFTDNNNKSSSKLIG